MAGAAKKRAKEARSNRAEGAGQQTAGVSSAARVSQWEAVPQLDGPPGSNAGDGARGRPMSNAPSQSGSRAGSVSRSNIGNPAKALQLNRNVDYPANVYNLHSQTPLAEPPGSVKMSKPARIPEEYVEIRNFHNNTDKHEYDLPTECIRRPGFNNTGTAVPININSYPILKIPDKTVQQYDVLIGSGVEKRGLITAVWNSKLLQSQIGGGWVFDGNRLAWNMVSHPARQFTIDLDVEKGRTPRPNSKPNSHKVQIRPTTTINLAAIEGYLSGTTTMDPSVLQAIDFLDHLMRVTPSKTMIAIKRSFFHQKMVERESISSGLEALKGIYQSIRVAQGGRLVVNVDVANTVFWGPWTMWLVAVQVCQQQNVIDLYWNTRKVRDYAEAPLKDSIAMSRLRKLKRVRFHVDYRNASASTKSKTYVVKDFSYENCYTWTFDHRDRETGETKTISIFDYFQKAYNVHLQHPTLPVVETMTRNVAFPMEVCYVLPGQRYPFKLDELQTANMIKFAATRPDKRRAGIEGGLKLLAWDEDRYLKNYGVHISPTMLETQARLLTPPIVSFNGGQQKPGLSGRWRIDGQKFLNPNSKPLISWGVCVINSVGRDQIPRDGGIVENFIRTFINVYKGHGGNVLNANPEFMWSQRDIAAGIADLHETLVNKHPGYKPQMIVFVLSGKESHAYMRIKKSCDCRFGVVSQCMQSAHVRRGQAQYISNVLMKFNAKLGGTTARVPGKANKGHFTRPTAVIGADVSHAAPGSLQPSMAAVTCSMDRWACRYAAACETNGHRVEMISQFNMESMLVPLFREWMSTVGMGRMPEHVIYFRDGVSEGQYQHVIQQELYFLKRVWRSLDPEDVDPKQTNYNKIKFTVIVASKRHHVRFFPKPRGPATDKNSNPCPGTLVERDVTHPFEYDFYLNSHSAIQGTARPTHYHVLVDEQKVPPSDLQNMIYEHCYQYMRSSTPVSIYPAVYYAHLASNRARSHEDKPMSSGPHKGNEVQEREKLKALQELADMEGKKLSKHKADKLKRFTATETDLLVPMKNDSGIRWGMWYI